MFNRNLLQTVKDRVIVWPSSCNIQGGWVYRQVPSSAIHDTLLVSIRSVIEANPIHTEWKGSYTIHFFRPCHRITGWALCRRTREMKDRKVNTLRESSTSAQPAPPTPEGMRITTGQHFTGRTPKTRRAAREAALRVVGMGVGSFKGEGIGGA